MPYDDVARPRIDDERLKAIRFELFCHVRAPLRQFIVDRVNAPVAESECRNEMAARIEAQWTGAGANILERDPPRRKAARGSGSHEDRIGVIVLPAAALEIER